MPSVSFYPVLEKMNCQIDKCHSWPWSSSGLVFPGGMGVWSTCLMSMKGWGESTVAAEMAVI